MDIRTRHSVHSSDVVIGRWLVIIALFALIALLGLASAAPLPL